MFEMKIWWGNQCLLHVGPQVPIHKLRKMNCPVERESNSEGHKRFVHDDLFLSNRRHSPRCGSSLISGHGGPAGAVISYVLEPGSNTCYYSNLSMNPRIYRRVLLGFTSSTVHIACTYLMVKFLWPFLRLFSPPLYKAQWRSPVGSTRRQTWAGAKAYIFTGPYCKIHMTSFM